LLIAPFKAVSNPTVSLHDSKSSHEEALLSYQIIETATEEAFNDIAALASAIYRRERPIT
jgi:hypothetical protein